MAKPGRKPIRHKRIITVVVDQETVLKAKMLGKGNLSAGIRRRFAKDPIKESQEVPQRIEPAPESGQSE